MNKYMVNYLFLGVMVVFGAVASFVTKSPITILAIGFMLVCFELVDIRKTLERDDDEGE